MAERFQGRVPRVQKVALITGGAIRIGGAITLGLAEAGYDVAINYHRSASEAASLARSVEKMGRKAFIVEGDVSQGSEVEAIASRVRERFGRLDLLVNNASIFRAAPLLSIEEGEWDRVMAVNLKGPFLMVKATADLLTAARGSVINLVDLSAFQPWIEYPHHSVSKAGLLHLTRVMARALAPHVRVNAIAPGAVLLPESYTEEERRRSKESSLLGTLGSPDDVVRTVLFLERSPFITGEVIVVDGGRLAR
jgi:NAD(P)-dependent dehydrogenase (short-subunit alcohol dehydrogenase family)